MAGFVVNAHSARVVVVVLLLIVVDVAAVVLVVVLIVVYFDYLLVLAAVDGILSSFLLHLVRYLHYVFFHSVDSLQLIDVGLVHHFNDNIDIYINCSCSL